MSTKIFIIRLLGLFCVVAAVGFFTASGYVNQSQRLVGALFYGAGGLISTLVLATMAWVIIRIIKGADNVKKIKEFVYTASIVLLSLLILSKLLAISSVIP